MGYIVTRRYVINAYTEEELFAEAIARADDEDTVTFLEEERNNGAGALAAVSVLTHMADVGDATDIVKEYDEQYEPTDTSAYFWEEDTRDTRTKRNAAPNYDATLDPISPDFDIDSWNRK